MLLRKAAAVESSRISPLAVTVTLPPLPQPEISWQFALEAIPEPPRIVMSRADTTTDPALPVAKLEALIKLFVDAAESRIRAPVALTVTLPAAPEPEARDEISEPASSEMFCALTWIVPPAPV